MAKDHIKPEHYKGKKYSPWEVIEEYFRDKWHVGTAFKYMSRMGKKIYPDCTAKESELHDTRKAIQELQRHEKLLVDEIESDRAELNAKIQACARRPEQYHYYVDDKGTAFKYMGGGQWERVSYIDTTFNYNHVPW